MKTLLVPLLLLLLIGCSESDSISSQISDKFNQAGTIDLTRVGPEDWDRVCILGPYSGNKETEQVLGFPWDAEANTTIAGNEGINVLVFSRGESVVAYSEHPRRKGDFSSVASTCSTRRDAKLTRKHGSWGLVWKRAGES